MGYYSIVVWLPRLIGCECDADPCSIDKLPWLQKSALEILMIKSEPCSQFDKTPLASRVLTNPTEEIDSSLLFLQLVA